jgi:predicted transcriptional regulator
MENALQHALKNAMSNPQVARMFDDEPDTKPSTSTLEKPTMQAQQTTTPEQPDPHAPYSGEIVRIIYQMLVAHPKSTCQELAQIARAKGYHWHDSISGQLKQLYDRGVVIRVKMRDEDDEAVRAVYRYWPTAMTLDEANKKAKEERAAQGKAGFSINKEKATKKKATQGLVPKRKPVPTVEQFEKEQAAQPIQMLRVGVDPKRIVESLSVRDARAVYEELKKLFS